MISYHNFLKQLKLKDLELYFYIKFFEKEEFKRLRRTIRFFFFFYNTPKYKLFILSKYKQHIREKDEVLTKYSIINKRALEYIIENIIENYEKK
jgi:hypothetical protein